MSDKRRPAVHLRKEKKKKKPKHLSEPDYSDSILPLH